MATSDEPIAAKRNLLTGLGVFLGALALIAAVLGDRLTLLIYSEPPPALLQTSDARDATAGDVAAALAAYGDDVTDRVGEKLREKGYERSGELLERGFTRGRKELKRLWYGADAEDETEAAISADHDGAALDARAPDSVEAAVDGEAPQMAEPAEPPEEGEANTPEQRPPPESGAAGKGDKWQGLANRFRLDFSGRSERQIWLGGLFLHIGLFGGVAAFLLALLGWLRREDGRAAAVAGILGFVGMAWAQVLFLLASMRW